jgi:hypothetical protein
MLARWEGGFGGVRYDNPADHKVHVWGERPAPEMTDESRAALAAKEDAEKAARLAPIRVAQASEAEKLAEALSLPLVTVPGSTVLVNGSTVDEVREANQWVGEMTIRQRPDGSLVILLDGQGCMGSGSPEILFGKR